MIDETGNRYGRLTVLERAGSTTQGAAAWLCQCGCGEQVIVSGSHLRVGATKSCGCLRVKDEIGNRYGKLVVIEQAGSVAGQAVWLCQCDCGNQHVVIGGNLRRGNVKSCGCGMLRGPDHPNWRGGRTTYDDKFTDEFRRLVRERDLFCCQVCGALEGDVALDVHHIDYDKTNTRLSNCIALCHSCHAKTNFNREYWHAHLTNKMMGANPVWRQLTLGF